MKVRCEKFPQLEVHDLKVKFVGGEAEVDEKTATKLVDMDGFGIQMDGGGASNDSDDGSDDSNDSDDGNAPEGGSDELALLKSEADALEIKYHPNIGVEKLRDKVAEEKAARLAAEQNQ